MSEIIKLHTLQEYANQRNIKRQGVYLLKNIEIIQPPLFALISGKYVPVSTKQKFVKIIEK